MGLFKKIKDILFDEEEYTEQIKITPEMRNEETPIKEVVEKPIKEQNKQEPEKKVEKEPVVSERELFNTDSISPFLDFDEEEFEKQKPELKRPEELPELPKRNMNVIEFETRKKVEKRTDYGRYEKIETTQTVERRKFKPSPIISPVYGVLDKNYSKDEILHKPSFDKVDLKEVRNKAFGDKKEEKTEPKVSFYEETETVTISEPEEKEKKVKTIDELLEDTSDLVVDIDRDLDDEIIPEIEETIEEKTNEPIEEQKPEEVKPAEEESTSNIEDTLENDLFDLIDSMYESKEEGE